MNFPAGFPSHLKPRAEAAILKASSRFKDNEDVSRMESGFFAFAEIAVRAAEGGEYDVELVHSALHEFLDYMFAQDPCGPPVRLIHPRVIAEHFKSELRRSDEWIGYMERLDAIASGRGPLKPRVSGRSIGERRKEVILPVLKEKGISQSRWADRAGVDPSVVYDYIAGKSTPRPENRKALAQAIGLPDLPE